MSNSPAQLNLNARPNVGGHVFRVLMVIVFAALGYSIYNDSTNHAPNLVAFGPCLICASAALLAPLLEERNATIDEHGVILRSMLVSSRFSWQDAEDVFAQRERRNHTRVVILPMADSRKRIFTIPSTLIGPDPAAVVSFARACIRHHNPPPPPATYEIRCRIGGAIANHWLCIAGVNAMLLGAAWYLRPVGPGSLRSLEPIVVALVGLAILDALLLRRRFDPIVAIRLQSATILFTTRHNSDSYPLSNFDRAELRGREPFARLVLRSSSDPKRDICFRRVPALPRRQFATLCRAVIAHLDADPATP